MVTVRRALLSCCDKAGLVEFAGVLSELGVELIASEGTAAQLRSQGLRVKTIEEFVGLSQQLDGRVKTLHPKIHAGILARRDVQQHLESVGPEGLIDLVLVNLYPFQRVVGRSGASRAEAIEQIDIGGVALLRAAAKNGEHVAVVCQPQQYPRVAEALRAGVGRLPAELTQRLAVTAFQVTSAYDSAIADFLAAEHPQALPEVVTLSLERRQSLRYGENPHQQAAWYVPVSGERSGLGTLTQLQGKELSYNNLLDIEAALRCLLDVQPPECRGSACVIMKHAMPCGLAVGGTLAEAFARACECDAESAFGGIVGVNRPLDRAAAEAMAPKFLEGVLAPAVTPEASAALAQKTALRLVTVDWPTALGPAVEWRQLWGSWLLQQADTAVLAPEAVRVVTSRVPSDTERADLLFAWRAVRHVKSNGIVLVKAQATVGIGQGQPSRVGSVRLAVVHAGARAQGAVAASDGFFPFADGVELLAKAGVSAVIQPGGSIRDHEVIAAAEAAGISLVMTGLRQFRH